MRILLTCGLIASLLLISCKKSDQPTEPANTVPSEVVGTWIASQWTFVSTDSASTVDVIAIGADLTVVLQTSGRYTLIVTYPNDPTEYETGVLSFSGDQMTITSDNPNEGITVMTWSVSGTSMTLLSTDDDFDFDDDGNSEPAIMTIVLDRQ